jgi:hypothetical protein
VAPLVSRIGLDGTVNGSFTGETDAKVDQLLERLITDSNINYVSFVMRRVAFLYQLQDGNS